VSGPVSAIVLAAGAGRRFGGGKLLATLDGRPILQHVLDALVAGGISDPVVVVGADAAAMDRAMSWGIARRITNSDPDRGLSSSLRLGWDAAMAAPVVPSAVLVVLGDQPMLDPEVVRTLVAMPPDPLRPVVVARYADGARNPVRLEPAAAPLLASATGDRGLGPLLDAHPELVRNVQVPAANPDVDARRDLVRLVETRWADRVRANAAQVEAVREVPDGADFYATIRRTFVADPAREDDPVLGALVARARPGETWLDIGAGAGRYALPIASRVREVIAVDPSPSMLAALRGGMATHGIRNIRTVAGRWPPDAELRAALGPDPVADVALIAHLGYDIEAIGPFLDGMEAAARRTCVAVLMEHSPAAVAAPFWPVVHRVPRVPLPALPEFLELLAARGAGPSTSRVAGERRRWADEEELVTFLRRQLWTEPGSEADARLMGAVREMALRLEDGSISVPAVPGADVGIVTWTPSKPD
jgi:CTP:molybdopterin cytidylyltransferase MocA/SAM-dependent methyltransferase